MKSKEEQFQAERLTGIGSSDAAVAMGLSKWRTPMDLYLEKRGEAPKIEQNDAMLWGHRLEPVVLGAFALKTGLKLEESPPMIRSEQYPWMIAHLDAQAIAPSAMAPFAVVDAKIARNEFGWGEDGSAMAPADYVIQVHHQMICAQVRHAYLPVLIASIDFRVIHIPYDDELGEMIVNAEHALWIKIKAGLPPEPRSRADVEALYRKALPGKVMMADGAIAEICKRLGETRKQMKTLQIFEDEYHRQIKGFMGEGEVLLYEGEPLVTWKNTTTKRIDLTALKHEAPDVAERFTVSTESRRFLPKKTGDEE